MAHLKPITSNGLTGDQRLRRAMQTPPPDHDPEPPQAVKAKRKTPVKKDR